jgi:hypothetical protein
MRPLVESMFRERYSGSLARPSIQPQDFRRPFRDILIDPFGRAVDRLIARAHEGFPLLGHLRCSGECGHLKRSQIQNEGQGLCNHFNVYSNSCKMELSDPCEVLKAGECRISRSSLVGIGQIDIASADLDVASNGSNRPQISITCLPGCAPT